MHWIDLSQSMVYFKFPFSFLWVLSTDRKLGYIRYLQHMFMRNACDGMSKRIFWGQGLSYPEFPWYFYIFLVSAIYSVGKEISIEGININFKIGLFVPLQKEKNKKSLFIVQIREILSKYWNFWIFVFQFLLLLIFHHYFPK